MSPSVPKTITRPPPAVANVLVSFPAAHVLLVTLNRPSQLNAMPTSQHTEMDHLFRWYDSEPWLRCAIITGAGRAFCAGADLKEWHDGKRFRAGLPTAGFGGLSNRVGKKPVVAAVNGVCLGGGMEMVINCDMVLAARSTARFGLPEVTRGVVAVQGGLARLARTVGRQRAAEMALLGRADYGADDMLAWGLVNAVVPTGADVVAEAVAWASRLAANSPDAVLVSREGLRWAQDGVAPDVATDKVRGGRMYGRVDGGENMREGLASFMEKRRPVWRDTKL